MDPNLLRHCESDPICLERTLITWRAQYLMKPKILSIYREIEENKSEELDK